MRSGRVQRSGKRVALNDASAVSVLDGIEVTPQMIKAGASLLDLYAEGSLGTYRATNVAEAVFRKMLAVGIQSRA